ncbi:hypothetical protein GIR22_08515 [Pseudomonas sp. CCM 7891]|uniref:Uncharacterized protein n=1 Tax=Pseudomonas karstica TaxID=1055468 RepID=A0A7X2RQK5_9PSED|nr:hypothetical protein [Pseudomonas karstica]MTD19193.1 hypothetical protein [Pseudomonas karstica]
MRNFKLLDRLLGRSITPAPFVAGESLGALQAAIEAGKPTVLPLGSIVVEAPKYPEAERIAGSIRDCPDDWGWARKGFDLIHVPSGFRLWVANEDYGLAEVHPNNGKTNFAKPEQAIIWPSVKNWLGHRKTSFTGKPQKATIISRGGTFWCFAKGLPWVGVGSSPAESYRTWRHAVSAQARNDMNPNEYLKVRSATL